ncbi:hypothetical protein WJX79_008935 [Trebouxia sp. C0005]
MVRQAGSEGHKSRFLQLTNVTKGREKDDAAQDLAGQAPSSHHIPVEDVITQVTRRDQLPAANRTAPYPKAAEQDGVGSRITWRTKLRSLLCCLAPPQNDQYFRSSEAEAVVIRPPRAALPPPRVSGEPVIGPAAPHDKHKKCLVLDLDETLVHSSFKPVPNPDFIIPVEIEDKVVEVYVLKRPFMDRFMAEVGERFEVVVFTASLSKYADPLLDLLDKDKVVRWRLFRESCCPYEGNYVKDLQCLGRDLSTTIIVDNSPHSYVFQPENAVPIGTFIDDMEDQELLEITPILMGVAQVDDVRDHLGHQIAQAHANALRGRIQQSVI